MQYLVEYHFGRLSPQVNAAVEAHIRDCKICQRQGLSHAATEKREVARQLRKVRPGGKKQISGRGRGVILFLALVAILQIGVYELSRGSGSPLGSLFGGSPAKAVASPTVTATATPAPLTASLTYSPASANTAALALSPDGKTLAVASVAGSSPTVTLWNATTGKSSASLSWPGAAAPGVLAWSPDGKSLAAADGALVGVWTLPTAVPAWTLVLPAAPALRVYDVRAATIQQQPDAATAFANGSLLRWSATGSLSIVPPSGSASPPPVTAPGGQQVDLWRVDGSHLFADGHGGVLVGINSSDAAKHAALLSWSPDSHFLLWASVSRSVAVSAVSSGSTPSPSVTSVPSGASGIPAPDAPASTLAGNVAASGHGDALLWFSPDGHLLAACDRTLASSALEMYDIASGRIVSQLPGACVGLTSSSLAWETSASAFVLAAPGKPIAVYPLAQGVS
ncbi:MAG: WD40 repeat domain-containing protein [Ktedonobacterales bacterium]